MAYRKWADQVLKRLWHSVIAVVPFALGVAVVWYFDEIRRLYGHYYGTKVILTAILLLGLYCTLRFIWCRVLCPCNSSANDKGDDAADTEGNNQSPYPEPGWKCISDFKYESDLKLMRKKETPTGVDRETQYIVAGDYTVSYCLDGKPDKITVPNGMPTDLVSVPPMFRFYVGRVGPHLESCIVHDYLYYAMGRNSVSVQRTTCGVSPINSCSLECGRQEWEPRPMRFISPSGSPGASSSRSGRNPVFPYSPVAAHRPRTNRVSRETWAKRVDSCGLREGSAPGRRAREARGRGGFTTGGPISSS